MPLLAFLAAIGMALWLIAQVCASAVINVHYLYRDNKVEIHNLVDSVEHRAMRRSHQ